MSSGVPLLTDAFGRIREIVHGVVDGLTPGELNHRLDGRANSITWLVWHLTRVQDDHVAAAAGSEQVWVAGGWERRFGLDLPTGPRDGYRAIGYGHSSADVDAVRVTDPGLLLGYHDAVHERTVRYVGQLGDADFDRIVDEAWDPPVTLGVRLVSVVSDDLQHAGQAAFVRGLVHPG
ncbi:mycothiol transferase [Parafrankia discariae]|uniref:mycothiol transferase n=1 Tax=Parafrankia discariae TaxID=365528 RepID=UPI000371BF82|nr:DinB family protein [Parafrankia discariae]